MPLLDLLDFTAAGLSVAYRATDKPQELSIHIRCVGVGEDPEVDIWLEDLIDTINMGGAGSNLFAPEAGYAELLSGDLDAAGPEFSFVLSVAAVAPVFMRVLVERLRDAGGPDNPVVAMSLFGSVPLDDTPWSVREVDVRAWLDDATAYPQPWPAPGFPLLIRDAFGATLRLAVGAKVDDALDDALRGLVFQWLSATCHYVNQYGEPILNEPEDMARIMPKFARARNEFRATIERFNRTVHSRNMLVNMLAHLHTRVVPVLEAEIGM